MRWQIDIDEMIQRAKLAQAHDSLGFHIVLEGETVQIDDALVERVEVYEQDIKEQQS